MKVFERIQGPHVVGSGDELELFGVCAGSCTVEPGGKAEINGHIEGDLVVLGGSVRLNGKVGGSVYANGGKVDIAGMVVGTLETAPGAKVKVRHDAMINGVRY